MNTKQWEVDIGVFCTWTPKPTPHAKLKAALDSVGVGEHTPPPYSVGESLKRSMTDYGKNHRGELITNLESKSTITLKVERHESANEDGYEMIAVQHGKSRNEYPHLFAARVDCNGSEHIELTDGGWLISNRYQLQEAYEHNRQTVSASAVGQLLVKMVSLLNGTTIREYGGLYFVSKQCSEAWVELCDAIEERDSSGNPLPHSTIIDFAEVRAGRGSMRMIATSITKEIMADAAKLMDEVQSGDLGKRAIENRQGLLSKLRRKAKEYEGILDSPLQDVRKALQEAETAAAMANMLAASDAA